MAKPIFIILLPCFLSDEKLARIRNDFENKLSEDYHVFICAGATLKPTAEFKMFSDKEIEPIQLNELKELLKPS